MSIGPGSLRRAIRGNKSLVLVLRSLTTDESLKYGYTNEHGVCAAWMTLHLETGKEGPHGERLLQDERFWSNEDV